MEISNNEMCDILVGEYGRKANAHLYEKEPAVGCFDEYGFDMLKALIQHTSSLLDDDMYESAYLIADILHVLPDVLIPGKKFKTGILQGSRRTLCRKNRGQYF